MHPRAPEPPQATPVADDRSIDLDVSHRFWSERASAIDAGDPRVVTLGADSPARAAREVRLYQAWMLRELEASGASFERVVDLGCGNGDWTVMLAARASQLTAVDFTAAFLALVRQRVAALPKKGELQTVQCDAASYEFDGPCDLVVSGAVLQYLSDDDIPRALGRIADALRPRGGTLYLRTTVARGADRRAKCTDGYQAIYRAPSWYLDALDAAGFQVSRWQLATDFVADEIGRAALGRAWPVVAGPLRLVRRMYRARRPTDVLACIARPAP